MSRKFLLFKSKVSLWLKWFIYHKENFFLVTNRKKGLKKAQDVLKCNKRARFNKINKWINGRRNMFICPGFVHNLPWIFKTVPSHSLLTELNNVASLLSLDFSFKCYNVCAVKLWLLNTSIVSNGCSTFWSFFPCRTDKLDVVNKWNERNSAWWDNFVSETVIEKDWLQNFRMSRRSRYKLADELRVNPDTCRRANSSGIRIPVDVEIFESAKKNLRIQKYQDMWGWGLRIQSALCCFTHEPTTSHVEAF